MAEILVLAEHAGDDVKKVTLELITLARRFGEPSVVWTGPGAEGGQARCAEYGAARMYVAADAAFGDYVTAPAAELLAQLVRDTSPALVGLGGSATEVVDFAQRPPRQSGTIVKDEGDGGVKVAEFLAAQKFI